MSAPIPAIVGSWEGIEHLASSVHEAGFAIPQKYAAWSATIAGVAPVEWRTHLLSHGSAYVRSGGASSAHNPELAKVRREHVLNPLYRDTYAEQRPQWFREEMAGRSLGYGDWFQKKADIRLLAQKLARAAGFQLVKKGYFVPIRGSLSLEVEIDVGPPGSTIRQIIMLPRLRHHEGGWNMFLSWEELLPGMFYYENGKDSAELEWGLRAFIAASEAFSASFREG